MKKWLDTVGLKTVTASAKLCSDHFLKSAFFDYNATKKLTLRPGAVPQSCCADRLPCTQSMPADHSTNNRDSFVDPMSADHSTTSRRDSFDEPIPPAMPQGVTSESMGPEILLESSNSLVCTPPLIQISQKRPKQTSRRSLLFSPTKKINTLTPG